MIRRKPTKKRPIRNPKPKLKSGFEKKVAKNLTEREVSFKYESETIPYVVPSKKMNYKPDFIITTKSGKKIYVEAKGYFDRHAREKMSLVIEQHPDKDIRLLFMRDNSILKKSKTKYSTWCNKKGIHYAVSVNGEVPEWWLDE